MIKSAAQSSIANTQKYRNFNGSYVASSDYKLDEVVLTSSVASVTFDVSNYASQGYKNLQIRAVTKSSATSGGNWYAVMQFNGDTGANYSWHLLRADASYAGTSQNYMLAINSGDDPNLAIGWGAGIIDILDFASTNKYKTIRSFNGWLDSTGSQVELDSGSWRSTSAITSITLSHPTLNIIAGSRFSLYGSI